MTATGEGVSCGRALGRAAACLALAGALAAAVPAGAAADSAENGAGLLVRRRVAAADAVVMPARIGVMGGGRSCPAGVEDAPDGAEVRLWLAAGKARRDEPGWSAILLLGDRGRGTVHLLFHAERTFTTMRFPVAPKSLWDQMRREVEEAGEGKLFALTPQGAPTTTAVTLQGLAVEERRLTTLDGFGHRKDFELQLVPDGELGTAALAVDALVQALRLGGDDWVTLTGANGGVPVGLAVTEHLPDTKSRYAEELVALERQAIAPDRFVVPAGYSEVPFVPECF
jgi:hypothetical protein